ncbi:MAG: hypothetical protein V5A64_05190 [Candidatus Thermoplasmatota archaeon]
MSFWNRFSKSKSKDQPEESEETLEVIEAELISEENEQETEKPEKKEETVTKYHETFDTDEMKKKKSSKDFDPRTWRNVETIEEKVDNLHVEQAIKKRSDVERKVDDLLEKK